MWSKNEIVWLLYPLRPCLGSAGWRSFEAGKLLVVKFGFLRFLFLNKTTFNMTTLIILLIVGLMAGILSGMVGVGGGVIIVPALIYFMSMSQHEAQGTSLAVLLLPVGILAVYNYYKEGYVDVKMTLIIASTFLIGGFLGSKIAISLDQNVVKKIFGGVLILVAIKMILGK